MASKGGATTKKRKRRAEDETEPTPDAEILNGLAHAAKAKYSHAETTNTTYSGQLERARRWWAEAHAKGMAASNGHPILGSSNGAYDPFTDRDAADCLYVRRKATPYAVVFYITNKCLVEECSLPTAEQTYAAILRVFETE